jgi:hypothetical protein
LALLRAVILDHNSDEATNSLRLKALLFVEKRAASSRQGKTLTPKQWQDAYVTLQNNESLVNFIVENARLPWAKVAYIESITKTARELMNFSAKIGVGLTSGDLPMCIIPKENRAAFCDTIIRLSEGRIQKDFSDWLKQDRHLAICWVMGFKPKGDDARPDRGLPPLTRMLIGKGEDLTH